ncbi:sigma-70 family RNA polymerase sigma factor [Ruminococcus bromii]|jgi:RNA polymerase sigma factor (sigma-70 family)|nr:sigma-70 family RNA polymerase sigma factor [Ruminococcus bromii]MTR78452.1 sigma-70 family RNA polymerase sigma factor [Ruminococcus bromii]MTR88588.1 sigma-70 family RNA polymerase sigma factor [Ruminococcus bromii]
MRGGYFMNISHLVEKIKKGDNKSFEKLYKLTEREVWFTCISFLKNETTAQDIMQETYITAFLKIQSLEKSSQIRSWLNRIAVNKCKNYLKGKGEIQLDDEIFENQAIVDERISIPEEYISDKAKREIILSIMQEVLSDVQYQTVIMHYFNEMTVDEIAEVFECSRGTVLSRLNYSRAKMKTAIEDYENKSGDKLHGVVFVPFFTTIFREQAKSLAVPNITIKLPNGQTLATSATKGFATGAKSTVSSIVKATANATVKAKVIAVVCGATILAGTSAVGISILAGCNAEKEPTEPSVISSTVQTSTVPTTVPKTTVPKAVKDLVDKGEIKVDKDGNITDKNGKKVEVKDGKVEVKTDDGKTVTVKVDDVKTTVSNKNNSNKGNTEKKEDTKSNTSSKKDNSSKTNTSDNDKKPASKPSNSSNNNQTPAKPSNSSSNNQKPAKPSESSKTETPTEKPKQKVWVDDYKTVHHEGYWKVVGTEEEPVYGWVGYDVCNDCGQKFSDAVQMDDHLLWELRENGGRGSYHHEKEYVQTGTKTVDKKEWVKPYDEKVKDGGHYEYR